MGWHLRAEFIKYQFFLACLVTSMAMNNFSTIIIKAIAVPIEVLMSGCFKNSLAGYSEKVLQIITVILKQRWRCQRLSHKH